MPDKHPKDMGDVELAEAYAEKLEEWTKCGHSRTAYEAAKAKFDAETDEMAREMQRRIDKTLEAKKRQVEMN